MNELVLTMLIMWPGSATTVQRTVVARYETRALCEAARPRVAMNLQYNSSLECVPIGKKKI
jgi:hypothetical protein